jgi:Rac GTPase-activating protein 1
VVIDEMNANINNNNNNNNNNPSLPPPPSVNIMTPILEQPTPTSQRIYSSTASSAYKTRTNATPRHLSARQVNNLLPLAKKYKKAHLFKAQVILNSELCAHCDKRTRFGKMVMRCRECDMIVHSECKDLLQRPCYPAINFPAQGCIADYVGEDETPHIPPILQMIINEIETKGLLTHEVGLYRVNGSDSQIKLIKDRLIKRHQAPDLRKINDVHVLCSFVKDFLNNLSEHLITYDSWFRFARACDLPQESDRVFELKQAIQDLPEANRDTLAFLVLHLQRISETAECKMPTSNLARVFGPSVVGNSSPNLSPAEIINELKIQHQVVESLIKLPTQFYCSLIETSEQQQQRLFKNVPKTPEMMRKSKTAVVLSSILGPAINVDRPYLTSNNNNNMQQ